MTLFVSSSLCVQCRFSHLYVRRIWTDLRDYRRRKKKWPCSYLECKGIFLVPSLISFAKQYDNDWPILQFLLDQYKQERTSHPIHPEETCSNRFAMHKYWFPYWEQSTVTKPRVFTLVTVSHVMTQWPSWQSELERSAPALAEEGKTWFCYVILHAQGLYLDVMQITQLYSRSYRIRFVVQSL